MRHVRVPVSQDVGLRFAARRIESGEGASRTGARVGRPWRQNHRLSSPVSARALVARHDGTRPAHARWRLTRVIEWGLGSRRSDSPCRRKPVHGAESCRSVSDPKGRCLRERHRDVRGRTRPSEAPPATWREGSAPEPRAPPAVSVLAQRSTARCLGGRDRPKRARFTARHLKRGPRARTQRTRMQPPIERRNCLITSPCEPRNRRRVMRGS